MSEHLSTKNEHAQALLQETVPFDVPEPVSEMEIQQAKDMAAEAHAAREQERKPSVDEARAAVDAAFSGLFQQPQLGKKQKLRQIVGINAYSKKETHRIEQQRVERQGRYQQAEATYQEAFQEDNLRRRQEESTVRKQHQDEEIQRRHEEEARKFNETWGSMELSLNQTLQNEAVAARSGHVSEVAPDDALAAAETSIAYHTVSRSEQDGANHDYPPQARSLAHAMERQGVEYRYDAFAPNSELGEAYDGVFTLNHEKKTNQEPTVRLYRGVREVNGTILEQASYAIKGIRNASLGTGEHRSLLAAKERAIAATREFTDRPSLDSMKHYAQEVSRYASPQEAEKLKMRIGRIEVAVASGMAFENALREEHVLSSTFGGGVELSPYIAASDSPDVAGFYADAALLAIDVPVSQIAGYGELGEILIKGELSSENIAGVAVRRSNKTGMKQHASRHVHERAASMIPAR